MKPGGPYLIVAWVTVVGLKGPVANSPEWSNVTELPSIPFNDLDGTIMSGRLPVGVEKVNGPTSAAFEKPTKPPAEGPVVVAETVKLSVDPVIGPKFKFAKLSKPRAHVWLCPSVIGSWTLAPWANAPPLVASLLTVKPSSVIGLPVMLYEYGGADV